ncbi:MAG: serine/threonine protein kinase [Acidobacteria bacterium]|nr:serine/threonine protein kinase [Acidobacteriota bacterium]
MQIGRYRVLGELGRGAMGIVYRAQDPAINRVIAIKSIRLNDMTDPEERARLRDRLFREAQSAGILSHPNIVTIYDILEEDGLAYIFMECVNGQPLDDILRSGDKLNGQLLIDLLGQTAAALDYAHRKGIIHRDVKPANVMVHEDSVAKVCDFGIAKITSQQMTQTGVMMGTPSYMSPELIRGETLTGASDQFALGVMAYEILTGKKPFTADYLPTLLFKISSEEPPGIHELNPTLGPLVDRAVRKALAKKPEDRYATCSEFMKVLQRAIETTPDWLPMARGSMPVSPEETTTGSGGRMVPPQPPAPVFPAPVVVEEQKTVLVKEPTADSVPVPEPAVVQTAPLPLPPPPPSLPDAPSMRIPIRDAEAGVAAPARSKAPMLIAAAAALAVAGYFGYSKLASSPAPVQPPVEIPAAQDQPVIPTAQKPDPAKPVPPPVQQQQQPQQQTPVNAGKTPVTPTPATPAAAPDKDFEVDFTATPAGAKVIVDAKQECATPCTLRLTPGYHGVQVALAGYVTLYRSVQVPQTLDLNVNLPEATGILAILTTPKGASITVDGKARSEVTPARITLREGTHKIELVLGNLKDSHDVTIKQGGIQQIQSTWQ